MKILTLVVLVLLALAGCTRDEEMTESERALLLTVSDFRVFGFAEPPNPGQFRKSVGRIDGKRELSYEFDTPGLQISSKIIVASSAPTATILEKAYRGGVTIGLKATGVDEQALELREKYGDSASLALLTINERPVGNVFSVVSGRKVLAVTFAGVHFKDVAPFQRFIGGKLDGFLKYEPPAP